MYLVEQLYTKVFKKEAPYYLRYSLGLMLWKPIRKYLNVVIIPHIPFNRLRVACYRMIGFRIGKNVFIGMQCYLDDMALSKMTIEENVTISYGCYFACHGKGQGHTEILIKKGAYLGMRCNLISGKEGIVIGQNTVIGAGSLINKSVPDGARALGVPIRVMSHHG